MPSRTPELGQVPVRQADITDGHGQTQKKPGTVGPAQPPAPLGCMEVGLITAGSRQPADAKIPRNLMKAMHLVLPSPLWQQETLNLSCPQSLSEPPQLGAKHTSPLTSLFSRMLVPFRQQHPARDTLEPEGEGASGPPALTTPTLLPSQQSSPCFSFTILMENRQEPLPETNLPQEHGA